MRGILAACVMAAAVPLGGCATTNVQDLMATASGSGPEDAYVVSSVAQEYEIARALGLQPGSQSLRNIDGRAFDVLLVTDPETGAERELWFDITRFFGRF